MSVFVQALTWPVIQVNDSVVARRGFSTSSPAGMRFCTTTLSRRPFVDSTFVTQTRRSPWRTPAGSSGLPSRVSRSRVTLMPALVGLNDATLRTPRVTSE